MGFMDKMKLAAKNADSKAGEELDKGKFKNKISNEKTEIQKLYGKIGTAYYEAKRDGKDIPEEVEAMCKEIDVRFAKIEEYEQEIERIEEEGKKEREQFQAEAEAAAKAKEEAKAAEKAKEESE